LYFDNFLGNCYNEWQPFTMGDSIDQSNL
jgi:hypothetical protein